MSTLEVQLPSQTLTIKFESGDAASASELLRRHHHPLNTRCGQRGLCEGCVVELLGGTFVHRASGESITSNGKPRLLRACDYRPSDNPSVIRIPARSLLRYKPQVVTDFRVNIPAASQPLCTSVNSADVSAAIDIGTTTVVVMLTDAQTGRVLASAADFNKQMHHGDDVLTRINLCHDPAMLPVLQAAVIEQTIIPLLLEAARTARVDPSQIRCIAVAGNTTMLHLLAGVDPSPMGVVPFMPAFLNHRRIQLDALKKAGIDAHVHLLPGCSAYVGADIAAGILATGMLYDPGPCLLVDIGTNGEIALKVNDRLYACSTAAGPAFEGAALSSGLRATAGAISHVTIQNSPRVQFEVIQDSSTIAPTRPIGICGSAYIDFLAQGRAAGLLTSTGRLEVRADFSDHIIPWQKHGRAFLLAHPTGDRPIVISEHDLSKLLQAKAAIAAGILTLLRSANLTPSGINTVYLAGGFGLHINIPNAIRAGLLPDFRPEQIQPVGNTSLAGAYLALLDCNVIPELARIQQITTTIELNTDPHFGDFYVEQLLLA